MSWIGRWNGVAYFAPLVLATARQGVRRPRRPPEDRAGGGQGREDGTLNGDSEVKRDEAAPREDPAGLVAAYAPP